MGGHRVQPWDDDRHHVVRDGSGHLRPPQALPCRHRSLHGGFCGLRRGVLARSAQPLARGPGGCGGDGQRNLARTRQRRISRSEVEELGDRHLDRDREHRHRNRPDARRLNGADDRLALDLHGQHSRRARRLALTWRFVAESRDERPRTFDIPGQLLFMTAVGAFAFAVIEGPHAGWLSGEIITLFMVAGAALAGFIFCERRNADPMMDLKLFGDRTYSVAIITIFAALFAVYGMLLVITQYMQNVRGFSPTDAGFLLLPYSMSLMIVSLTAGKLVGVVGSRRLILLGIVSQILGFAVLIVGLQGSTVVVGAGLVFVGAGTGLCLTPITSLAMTAVPTQRAGMASGIMSAQRALGSTVGFAVLGSILAATLTTTLSVHLANTLPDPTERKEVADMIIGNANPRAYSAEIGPGRPIKHLNPATQKAILAVADRDFVEGIRFSLVTAIGFLALVLAAGIAWFPRGSGSIADAEREARALVSEETARESPIS